MLVPLFRLFVYKDLHWSTLNEVLALKEKVSSVIFLIAQDQFNVLRFWLNSHTKSADWRFRVEYLLTISQTSEVEHLCFNQNCIGTHVGFVSLPSLGFIEDFKCPHTL